MNLRKLTFPKDFETLPSLVVDSFQYPENPDWSLQPDEAENIVDSIKNLRRMWPLFAALGVFSPGLKELLNGYIWEEDGEPAGLVMAQRRGQSDTWFITTVAVNPNFRRRGIARKMVETALDEFRQHGGKLSVLDVISGNVPAYSLYESLGFEHFSSQYDLEFQPKASSRAPELPPGYRLQPSSLMDWQPRYELEKRVLPEQNKRYEPVEEARFRQPGYVKLIYPILMRAQSSQERVDLIVSEDSQQAEGYIRYTKKMKGAGRHSMSVRLSPAHEHLAGWAVQYGLHQMTEGDLERMVEMACPGWQPAALEAAKAAGFKIRLEFHRMGLEL